jgi:hypothetical protein
MSRDLNLPEDLSEFLKSGRQLEYDPDECDVGPITLLRLDQLKIELFPTDTDNGLRERKDDPHKGELGCYLVPAVSLVATCEEYEPVGLLIWLPQEGCYGTWDDSHTLVQVFPPTVTWTDIAANPEAMLNSIWEGVEAGGPVPLIPWPRYAYDPQQRYEPLPIEPRA